MTDQLYQSEITFPKFYQRRIAENLAKYDVLAEMEPWYFMEQQKCFFAHTLWPNICNEKLFIFARRQDNDDLAAFLVDSTNKAEQVYILHGWTNEGFGIMKKLPDIWSWMHMVIDDMQEWVELNEYL
ncbi:unnamed protein product [Commensalibacter communis]|uniref:hypothetical protein n=1 Tax=Commensalibacter communis TaxID=2972786 RepID=UPI0022FF4F43|nr:hypothetical protein [Commensalibacter communis]CAI3949421.1 unnamed protein product [Commensalibacter communis]